MPDLLSYISIPALILFSAFFSASEIAFASVSALRMKTISNDKQSISRYLAAKIHSNYQSVLTSIVVGNTLVNIAASSIAAVIVINIAGGSNAYISTIIMTVLILIFGEVIPKVIAKAIPDKYVIFAATPLYIISLILRPITFIFDMFLRLVSKLWKGSTDNASSVTEDDLKNIIDIVEDEGVLDEDQTDLLQNALDFDDVCAYEIITPRVDMASIDIHDPYEKNEKFLNETDYSRIPVYEDTPDNIIGILHINHYLKERINNDTVSIRDLLIPAIFIHKTMPLTDVLEKMKETKCHMLVVLDEYGGTMGIITLEDVMEQLVGEIFDESDDFEPEFVCIDDTHFKANGEMRIEDFFDEFDIDIEEDEEYGDDDITLGGFVTTMLDGDTSEGNTFEFHNLLFTVLDADEKRVEKVAVEILPVEEDED